MMNPHLMKQIEEGMKAARMKKAQGMMGSNSMPEMGQYMQPPPVPYIQKMREMGSPSMIPSRGNPMDLQRDIMKGK